MSFFAKNSQDNRLFINEPANGESGFWIAVFAEGIDQETLTPEAIWNPPPPSSPEEDNPPAETSPTPTPYGLLKMLVYCADATELSDAAGFAVQMNTLLPVDHRRERALAWLLPAAQATTSRIIAFSVTKAEHPEVENVIMPEGYFLGIKFTSQMKIELAATTFELDGIATFADLQPAQAQLKSKMRLPLSGNLRGRWIMDMAIAQDALSQKLLTGWQFHFPTEKSMVQTQWMPLTAPNSGQKSVFKVVIHPIDVYNESLGKAPDARSGNFSVAEAYEAHVSYLEFTGKNDTEEETVLETYYRTIFGEDVQLIPLSPESARQQKGLPARLLWTKGWDSATGKASHYLTPEGDFVFQSKDKSDTPYELICGLQGTEFFEFRGRSAAYAGDRIRFLAGQPAYAPNFPFREVSPLGPPLDAKAPLLTKILTTSWATLVPGAGEEIIEYVPQAQDAALYGIDAVVSPIGNLLGHMTPAYALSQSGQLLFPMPCYGGVIPQADGQEGFTREQLEMFESQVLATVRRDAIGDAAEVQPSSRRMLRERSTLHSRGTNTFNVTTPDGVIITIDASGNGARWKKITLGQKEVFGESKPDLIAFHNPKDNLQQAFSTADMCLVVANAVHLGANQPSNVGADPSYDAQINMENWILNANVGANVYGDYSNVLIFKSQRGALYDPDPQKSLVANPNKWTQKVDFAAPTTKDNPTEPDTNQLVVLANWLQQYFQEAAEQKDNPFFEKFNALAIDPNWQGFLMLRMDIQQLPSELAGIRAGVKDESAFYAHHFGIEINQIQKNEEVNIKDDSSMFGLIYYQDPDFEKPAKNEPVQPVPPDNVNDYDFRLLTLKVLFANSTIKDFESYAQVRLNKLFGMHPVRMSTNGNAFNTLVLRGSYHNVNGKPIYGLSTETDYSFFFDNNLFNKIEITGAQLLTRNIKDQDISCWFALRGYLDFRILTRQLDNALVDLIGFGGAANLTAGEDGAPRQGLHFSGLGLTMNFNTAAPQDKTFLFNVKEIRFDLARSTSRKGSLYTDFAMELRGMLNGSKDAPPAGQGYLNVTTDVGTAGVGASEWYGLRYQLNLGTPGELAGKINLDAELLFAWSPDSVGEGSYKAMIGIELPGGGGTSLFDLQNVLKLSIGQVRLLYADQGDRKGFLLMLTEIALKFLGLLKIPPSGSTNFYLFGNPEAAGEPSGLGWYAIYRQQV